MSGDWNSGHLNSGNRNSGNLNSGDWNSGNRNSGDWNSGDLNSGDLNSGNRNSGHLNSGNLNSGNLNSGNRNSGDWNSGDRNSGDWNSGNRNSGYFNTDEPTVRMFNKETGLKASEINIPEVCYFRLTEWVEEDVMSKEEKDLYPDYKTLNGYLKVYDFKEAFRRSWDKASEKERKEVLDLPNFDADIFLEISGIDVRKELKDTITVSCNGKSVEISRESAAALGLITER